MLIQRIKISNYKTYLDLDLDLSVDAERPIILIGGSNGGGKTTLFEAISGALYGLKIESAEHFNELLNQGAIGKVAERIELQITFIGKVLGQEQKYILKRTYQLNPQGRPLESVSLNMNGNMFVCCCVVVCVNFVLLYKPKSALASRISFECLVERLLVEIGPQCVSKI